MKPNSSLIVLLLGVNKIKLSARNARIAISIAFSRFIQPFHKWHTIKKNVVARYVNVTYDIKRARRKFQKLFVYFI